MTNQPHSPEFIAEMKAALEQEKTKLEQEINPSDDFPEYGRNEEDNVTEVADFQTNKAATEALTTRLNNITAALERIESGTYGTTPEGDTIPEARLRANPAATDIVK